MDVLLERERLFGNPDRASVRLSPDGAWLSYLAPEEGVLNVWIAPADDPAAARAVTHDRGRGIAVYFWARSSERVLTLQDRDGDENWRLISVDPRDGAAIDLTPLQGVAAYPIKASDRHPHHVLVGLNDRDPQLHDPYRIDVRTGERTLLFENPGLIDLKADDDLQPRFASRPLPDGSHEIHRYDGSAWVLHRTIAAEDALGTHPLHATSDGRTWYWLDCADRDTTALVREDLETAECEVVAHDPRADVTHWLEHPRTGEIQAAWSTFDVRQLHDIDPAIGAHLRTLEAAHAGSVEVISRSRDDALWAVAWLADDGPIQYGLYRPETGAVEDLFLSRTALRGLPLAKRHPVVFPSRDGLDLVSYLSLPRWCDGGGRPDAPLPMVLLVHGGPWARDAPGYHPHHQLLANRGYAVLSVNFRGSTGFGKSFLNAGNLQWAAAMHDDLLDAVRWAVDSGVAQPDRVAIMGGSYGGYAALVGLTFTPEVFACGVDIVGPSNLLTLLQTIPPYWAPMIETFTKRVGDHRTEEGRALLQERSPLNKVDQIVRPLLIAQGANDPRVKQAESDQIVAAMEQREIPVTYALFPDEGHGFNRPENNMAFWGVAESFLAQCLGGRAEPLVDLEGSTLQVPAGAEHVPGLADLLGPVEAPAEAPAEEASAPE